MTRSHIGSTHPRCRSKPPHLRRDGLTEDRHEAAQQGRDALSKPSDAAHSSVDLGAPSLKTGHAGVEVVELLIDPVEGDRHRLNLTFEPQQDRDPFERDVRRGRRRANGHFASGTIAAMIPQTVAAAPDQIAHAGAETPSARATPLRPAQVDGSERRETSVSRTILRRAFITVFSQLIAARGHRTIGS